jgi:N6-L-threonylcarbamoyladenine synthase
MITLGIETSCDETGIALLDNDRIIANAVYSQYEHTHFGGVVPEIASRAHLEKIETLTATVLDDSSITAGDLDAIAVTDSPGLAGALLIGISFALGLHVRNRIPITGVNHLEGHICSILLSHPDIAMPFLALVASGGHTAIYRVDGIGRYTCLGQTVDDAAGEAFDKVGKLIGFPYPAGRAIEAEAQKAQDGDPISFPIARFEQGCLDFSFSGLKTAVKYFITRKGKEYVQAMRPNICRDFQEAVVTSLVRNCMQAAEQTGIQRVALVGGVACNGRLRTEMKKQLGDGVYFPDPALCADNGAMIACAGAKRFELNLSRFPHMQPGSAL